MTMTPDEVVSKEIEAIENILYSDLNLSEGTKQALHSAISLIQDYQKLRERVSVESMCNFLMSISGNPAMTYERKAKAIVTYLQQPTEH